MKIVVVNRNFFLTGGPEKYMFSLMGNLPQHRFIPFCVDFQGSQKTPYSRYFVPAPGGAENIYFKDYKMSFVEKLAYAANSIYNLRAKRKLETLIESERPDVALFLNAVYFSDSIIDACRRHGLPIIWRLSDFNRICASYLLYRDGRHCEDCLSHGLYMAIRNRCGGYQRSLSAALVKTAGMWLSRVRRLNDAVDYFITPSSFTRQKMIQALGNPEKIIHIPTCIENSKKISSNPATKMILYLGRLSPEKGVDILLKAFGLIENRDARLVIAGDNKSDYAKHLMDSIPVALRDRIAFPGFQNKAQIETLFINSTCVVVPSVCYENQPNVVIEAMAQSRPVIVSDIGSLREMVSNGQTGYRFKAGDAGDLTNKLNSMLCNPQKAFKMGRAAKHYVEKKHSKKKHFDSLDLLLAKCLDKSI
jgi:glycosyltransferase involved in cell wall biosynthesis